MFNDKNHQQNIQVLATEYAVENKLSYSDLTKALIETARETAGFGLVMNPDDRAMGAERFIETANQSSDTIKVFCNALNEQAMDRNTTASP